MSNNTSVPILGSKPTSRKHSLDLSAAFTNLRRRSQGYEDINEISKDEDGIKDSMEGNCLEMVESSSKFVPLVSIIFFLY